MTTRISQCVPRWVRCTLLLVLALLSLPALAQMAPAQTQTAVASAAASDDVAPDYSSSRVPVFNAFDIASREGSPDPVSPVLPATPVTGHTTERFHWEPALKQSLYFLLVEHGFRIVTDPYARHLLLHKPFWHDYGASFKGADMTRWGDGDDFLVNYIGHPLQGAVTGYIYLNNDPSGRSAKFGKNRQYWLSRLRAMGWSTLYSTEFEVGPVLSETAIGNEGGYTYIPKCGFYPTCVQKLGVHYKPPTNNSGWVDLVVTPTIGTGWVVLEDFLEVKLVDKFAKGSHATKYKILRGAITPGHSFANLMAGHLPWWRYEDQQRIATNNSILAESFVAVPQVKPAWQYEPRRVLDFHFTTLNLPMDTADCQHCRTYNPGMGVDFSYRFARLWYADSTFDYLPQHGGVEALLVGLRFGRTYGRWGLFTQARPGFVHYGHTLVPGTTDDYASAFRFALDLGGSAEYHVSPRNSLRVNAGSLFVRYLTGRADPRQPPVSVLSHDYYATQGNLYISTGYQYRF